MDFLLSFALSTLPIAPATPARAERDLDLEFAAAVLMAEHRLSIPIYFIEGDSGSSLRPAGMLR